MSSWGFLWYAETRVKLRQDEAENIGVFQKQHTQETIYAHPETMDPASPERYKGSIHTKGTIRRCGIGSQIPPI
jgi:hypothetical protein